MTKTYSLSRFAIPFHRDGKYLLFSSKTCNFYELDRGTYDFLEDLRENPFTASEKEDIELLDSFRAKGISTIIPGFSVPTRDANQRRSSVRKTTLNS